MIVGILIVIIPFLGFPSGLIKFVEIVCGLLIVGLAYSMAPKIDLGPNQANVPFKDYRSTTAVPADSMSPVTPIIPDQEITNPSQEQK